MANISYTELQEALKKSGLPMGEYQSMKDSLPYAKGAIQGAIYGSDSQIPQYTQEYKNKLKKIADMDKRLSGLYSDKSSPLYIERATTREGLTAGAENVGYQDANSSLQKIQSRQQELDQQAQDALTLFRDLIPDKPLKGDSSLGDIEALMRIFGQGAEEPNVPTPMSEEDYGFKNVSPEALDSMTFEDQDPLESLYADSVLEDLYNQYNN